MKRFFDRLDYQLPIFVYQMGCLWYIFAMWVALISLTGCATITPGSLDRVQSVSDQPRLGNVYLLRGFIGVFSDGINSISQTLDQSGVRATVYQDDQWDQLGSAIRTRYANSAQREPIVLIGHSFGADDVLRISRDLEANDIPVDLVVTIDPVIPPVVPANVKCCYNLYQSNGVWDKLPLFRGIPLSQETGSSGQLRNMDVRKDRTDLLERRTNHFNIEKNRKIHAEVVKQVLSTCPPRVESSARSHFDYRIEGGGS